MDNKEENMSLFDEKENLTSVLDSIDDLLNRQMDKFIELQEKKQRKLNTGVLGGINEKYFIRIDDKDYLFKYVNSDKDYSDFGEVITSQIANFLGIECVKSVFSNDFYDKDRKGTLISSYRTDDINEVLSLKSLLIKYGKNSININHDVNEAMEVCEEFSKEFEIVLDNKIEQRLKEMALLDFLLVQVDRNSKNIEFLIKEKDGKKNLELASIFDNGYCMSFHTSKLTNKMTLNNLKNQRNYDEVILHRPRFCILKNEHRGDDADHFVTSDLAEELLKNRNLMEIYLKFKKINIEKYFDYVVKDSKRNIPNVYKETAISLIRYRIKTLDIELLKQSIRTNFIENKGEDLCE